MVTMLYVIFGFVGLCVCVCFGCCVFERRLVLGVRRASACAVRHKYFHCTIFFHPSGISFVVLLDMRSLKKTVTYKILPTANMRCTYEGIGIYVDNKCSILSF